jgi:hypothetical protein
MAGQGIIMSVQMSEKRLHEWHRNRLATDIAEEPEFIGDHAFHQSAYLNWADLERIGNAIQAAVPEVVFFPGIYIDRDQRRAPPPEAHVPIFTSLTDCVRKTEHYKHVPHVSIRWPWADEVGSDNPDVLAGRINGANSPWHNILQTRWERSRRIGRVVSLNVRFKGYVRVQDIKIWNGDPYWGQKRTPDGRRASDIIPESWRFWNENSDSSLEGGYHKSSPDKAYFSELIKRIWRQNTTDIYALHDIITGELWDNTGKSRDWRYGFNALKHAVDGTRRYVGIFPDKDYTRFSAIGPRKAHIKKAMATIDSPLDFE